MPIQAPVPPLLRPVKVTRGLMRERLARAHVRALPRVLHLVREGPAAGRLREQPSVGGGELRGGVARVGVVRAALVLRGPGVGGAEPA